MMQCTWSLLNPSTSFFSNIKSFHKYEKYIKVENGSERTYFLNNFIRQLELSPEIVKILTDDMRKTRIPNLNFHSHVHRNNINLLIKRTFLTARPPERVRSSKSDYNSKTLDPIRKILEAHRSKPETQLQIIEAFHLGGEKTEFKPPKIYRFLKYSTIVLGAIVAIYLASVLANHFAANNISKIFSKSFSESNVTLINKTNVTLDDVHGCDEVKKEIENIIYFLKNPNAFTKIGAQLPKGLILNGPPGVGKTLLAKAVAGEAGVSFLYASGSQFDEMFVGVGASRIRAMFNAARENAPCVVFIDELDAVCGTRTSSMFHPYANQTINQLLAEMDGFSDNEGVIIIGATNRIEALDKAVLRPGRFDLKISVYPPDYLGRMSLFNFYLSKVKSDDSIDVVTLAKSTIGQTGADIKNLVNQAAIICTLQDQPAVSMNHLLEAESKIQLGAVRNRSQLESDNRNTAYHEAGHSIVNYFTSNNPHKIKQVTILPRGYSGGHNSFVPKDESYNMSKNQILARLDSMMGGRAAEELLNGTSNITTGVADDMKQATELAKALVKSFSMSDIGLQVVGNSKCECGGQVVSPKLSDAIDTEVTKILNESYNRAKAIIQEHEKEWRMLANSLMKYETLNGEDVELIIKGKKPKVAIAFEGINDQNKKPIAESNQFFGLFSGKNAKK